MISTMTEGSGLPPSPGANKQSGWYPVGENPNDQAYWDGQAWTARRKWGGAGWVEVAADPVSIERPVAARSGRAALATDPRFPGAASSQTLVQAGFGSPDQQNRWTIAFRFLLAIPHLVVLGLEGILAVLLVVIGWFAALVLGRLPRPFASYLSRYITYLTRVNAYLWLMLDRYPPFSPTAPYPVNIDIPVGRVRRLAVLFRIILMIPANIVSGLASSGMGIAALFIWLIVLVAGRMPTSLFGAVAGVLRFQARYVSYAVMLTGKYPGEIYGDQPIPTFGVGSRPVGGPAQSPPYSPEVAAQTPIPSSLSFPEGAPRTARLVLNRGAKRIITTFIVLGTLGEAANISFQVIEGANVSAYTTLVQAHNRLAATVSSAQTQRTRCELGELTCLDQYWSLVSTAFSTFHSEIVSTSFPADSEADAARLENVTYEFKSLLTQLVSEGPAVTAAQLAQLETAGDAFDKDYSQLVDDLL